MEGWTPRKLILASLGVAIFSSALTGGIVVWLLSGQKQPEAAVFFPSAPSPSVAAPAGTPPSEPVEAGNWYYDHQRWPEAIAAYEKALSAGLDNPDVRTDLGNCYRFTNRPDAALEQYQLAQKQDPSHEHSLYNQAGLYAEVLHDPVKASEVAHEFVRRFPNSTSAKTAEKYFAAP